MTTWGAFIGFILIMALTPQWTTLVLQMIVSGHWSQTYLKVLKVVNDVYRLVGRNLPRNHTIYIMSHDVLTLNSLLTRVWDRVLSHFLMKNISSFRHMTRHWKKLLTHGDLGNPCHVLLGRVEFHIPV